ncbi:glucose-6-phosphate dehydrogenase [Patescibacteria group bacterium]|nr:glucose-6-phosphate dehydrogenase [Patescibacteria group bacterium]
MNNPCSKIVDEGLDFIIFGSTGDLSHRKLFPALYNLYKDVKYKDKINIIALGRKEIERDEFLSTFTPFIENKDKIEEFFGKIIYKKCDFTSTDDMNSLSQYLLSRCRSRIFYLAVPPLSYEEIISSIGKVGLQKECIEHKTFTRIILEKPFGYDLSSTKRINRLLLSLFKETQIFRIDHYLGKEPIQNILAFRFVNNVFENIWNNKFISKIEINLLEDIGIEKRGIFYEETGVLIDVFQNHILQMLSIITMNKPKIMNDEHIRREKNKILQKVRLGEFIKGQYEGYTDEENVSKTSLRETFLFTKVFLKSKRWRNVPIYIKSGKDLKNKDTNIKVYFKKIPQESFSGDFSQNILDFMIQPELGIYLNFGGKVPGEENKVTNIKMEYLYTNYFGELKSEYEKLLIDCIQGKQMNFASTDEIETAWQITDRFEKRIKNIKPLIYKKHSLGPELPI